MTPEAFARVAAYEYKVIRPERAARLLTPASWTLAALLVERDYLADCGAPTDVHGCYEMRVTDDQLMTLMDDDAFAAAAREVSGPSRLPYGTSVCGIRFIRSNPAERDTR